MSMRQTVGGAQKVETWWVSMTSMSVFASKRS